MSELGQQILKELDYLSESATFIPKEKRYWLIRTKGGEYYDSFREHNFVAINYSKIDATILYQLHKVQKNNNSFYGEVRNLVTKYYKEKHPGLASNQIYNFVREMKKGDTVIIPSGNSDNISFGEVLSNSFYVAEDGENNLTDCPFDMRRRIEWFDHMRRSKVDPYFSKVFQSHHAVNDVSHYREYIERSTAGFYQFEDKSHLVINIKQDKALDAEAVFGYGYELMKMAKEMSEYYDLGLDFSDFKVIILLNSEGKYEWITKKLRSATFLGVLTVMINGGGLKIGEDFQLHTPGIIQGITNFLDAKVERRQRQELLEKYSDNLKVKEPEEFIDVMKQFDDNKDLPE